MRKYNNKEKINHYNKARLCNLNGACGTEYKPNSEFYLITLFGLNCLNANR